MVLGPSGEKKSDVRRAKNTKKLLFPLFILIKQRLLTSIGDYITWLDQFIAKITEIVVCFTDALSGERLMNSTEPMVDFISATPYNDYPVVGVGWVQTNSYAKWRGDRVNEAILFKKVF